MERLFGDLRLALRTILRRPGVAAVAAATLAIGIAATTTVYSWMSGMILRPLRGVPDLGALVAVMPVSRNEGFNAVSYPDYAAWRDRTTTVEGITAFAMQALGVSDEEGGERIWGLLVSGNYFEVLRVRAALGRTLLPGDDRGTGERRVAVISHGLWQRRFGGDPGIIGREIYLNTHACTIIGVAPREFTGTYPGLAFDLWVPLSLQPVLNPPSRLEDHRVRWLEVFARLRKGVTPAQAGAELSAIGTALGSERPIDQGSEGVRAFPVAESPRSSTAILRPMLLMLLAVAGAVLLIACANVANLQLARLEDRRRDVAVRLSLGARPLRVMRQLLLETLVLALIGGVVGVLASRWAVGSLGALLPPNEFPVDLQAPLDLRVLAFACAIALATTVLAGLAPVLQAVRRNHAGTLKDHRTTTRTARRSRLRTSLVVAQVALSVLLLTFSALFIRALLRASTLDPGFDADGVLLASLNLAQRGDSSASGVRFIEELLDATAAVPGVTAVSCARRVPLGFGGPSSVSLAVEGYVPAADELPWAYYNAVGPGYFATLRTEILRGRDFSRTDRDGALAVAIVNETLARRYWPQSDAVGGRLRAGDTWYTVVGVVRDGKYSRLDESPAAYLFLPVLQAYRPDVTLHVRTAGEAEAAAAVRRRISELDPELPVWGVRSLESAMQAATFPQRVARDLLAATGAVALLLAAVGLYGVLSVVVAGGSREIGVRLAFGARPRDILRMVLVLGMRPAGVGILIGAALAAATGRTLESLLLGVEAFDPPTFVVVPLLLATVALLACVVPACRAIRVDPATSLRHE